ncbi:MAG: hypothetical protein K6A89_01265 [Treponema sp.]|nr:hypothetical protein [Treponema sp.]
MKKNKFVIFAILLFCSTVAFAQEAAEEKSTEENSPFSLSLTTDFAYYPASKSITGGDHFAPITGPYSGVEGATTLKASYVLNTPLGKHWLVSGANVDFTGALELTPISLRPKLSISFTPVPFLIFSAGGSIGWGWNFLGIEGLCKMNKETLDYEELSTSSHPYYDVWASATFQFDTGALIPGDWSHVVILASYTTAYSGLAGLLQDTVFEWQCGKNRVRGLTYDAQGVLGYQMPIPLSLAGVMFKAAGYYDGSVYGEYDKTFDGAFVTINISPLLQFKFGAKDNLTCLFDFSSRRSFEKEIQKAGEALTTKVTGREWYFNRFALSWTHNFM